MMSRYKNSASMTELLRFFVAYNIILNVYVAVGIGKVVLAKQYHTGCDEIGPVRVLFFASRCEGWDEIRPVRVDYF